MTKPTIATMTKEMDTLLSKMNMPIEVAIKRANVEWTNPPKKAAVTAVLEAVRNAHLNRMTKINAIQQLGGTADITMTHKELTELLSELKVQQEEQQTTNNEKVETTMENKQTAAVGITQEQLNTTINEAINKALTEVVGAVQVQIIDAVSVVADRVEQINTETNARIDKSGELTKTIVAQLNQLNAGATANPQVAATTQEQPVDPKVRVQQMVDAINKHHGTVVCAVGTPMEFLEGMMAEVEKAQAQAAGTTTATDSTGTTNVNVDPNAIVYTSTQIAALEAIKATGDDSLYNRMKESYDRLNKTVGRTAGNFLNNTASFIDDVGHKGVDGVADFLDSTIDMARNLIVKATEFTADTAKAVNNVGRNAGHVIVNGTVYTIESAANFNKKQ